MVDHHSSSSQWKIFLSFCICLFLYTSRYSFVKALGIYKPSSIGFAPSHVCVTQHCRAGTRNILFSSIDDDNYRDSLTINSDGEEIHTEPNRSFRKRVKRLTKRMIPWNSSTSTEITGNEQLPQSEDEHAPEQIDLYTKSIVDQAFAPAEESIRELEEALVVARAALANAKLESYNAIADLASSKEQPIAPSILPTNGAEGDATVNTDGLYPDLDTMAFEDVDYESSEMAPPFLDEDSCLMPDAEPLVRVEKAPDNSRRIFAGIDILASTDDVWNVLTNYHELQNVIPNLVVNDVLDLYDGEATANEDATDEDLPEEIRCANLSRTMKGSLLRQVGGAKVAGINFSAKTTLEVREWPNGMPDFAHFMDDMWEGKSREERAKEYPRIKLKRYRFPRPFAVSNLPTRDISMQSIANDDGEFRLYQGVWRMQPLVGCSPPGKNAMRLTYAVEISPRVYLPVKLIEGRIVRDLCANLEAIREVVSGIE